MRSENMRRISRLGRWVNAAVLCLIAGMSSAQTVPPEGIIDSAQARLVAQDWAGFAGYLHNSTLQEFKFYLMKIAHIREQAKAEDPRFSVIFGRPTIEEIQNAPAEVLFSNFLRAAVAAVPEFGQVLIQTKYQRLGVIGEGEELKHVVVRQSYAFGDNTIRTVEVITLQKEGEGWKMLLPPTIKTFLDELGWPVAAG